jgi:hypothetical protein
MTNTPPTSNSSAPTSAAATHRRPMMAWILTLCALLLGLWGLFGGLVVVKWPEVNLLLSLVAVTGAIGYGFRRRWGLVLFAAYAAANLVLRLGSFGWVQWSTKGYGVPGNFVGESILTVMLSLWLVAGMVSEIQSDGPWPTPQPRGRRVGAAEIVALLWMVACGALLWGSVKYRLTHQSDTAGCRVLSADPADGTTLPYASVQAGRPLSVTVQINFEAGAYLTFARLQVESLARRPGLFAGWETQLGVAASHNVDCMGVCQASVEGLLLPTALAQDKIALAVSGVLVNSASGIVVATCPSLFLEYPVTGRK